ncbi:MAG: bifunctional metallophosphatase/5'-nucleotidase [Muribaculaceae bacterium]|nr:bifunctional metallophosphatase/5'-nucleotidase [Muribaculaceae bacterium]
MKKRFLLAFSAICLFSLTLLSTTKEVHIISTNDMHANIQAFPQLAALTDSVRSLYPSLLVLSAGDNRTGDPLNDIYEIPAYPMVALMNQVGFHASALGNHEFDSKAEGLGRVTSLAHFTHLCANIHADPALGIHTRPYQIFDVDGIKVGIVGVVQVGMRGIPDTHPDNCKGITFTPVEETVQQYKWLRDQCDVVILLTHIGYDDDVKLSKDVPWADLIVGGHSHTQLKGGEMHNGVLITQTVNRLDCVTHTTITLDDGKVVDKRAENISVTHCTQKNKVVEEMVKFFSNNPEFQRVLCQVEKPFTTYEELGCLMSDALREETHADVGFINRGGVRYETHDAGPFTVSDVLKLDPFGNDVVEMNLTGEELRQMLLSCSNNDTYGPPCVSGITLEYTLDKNDTTKVKNVKILTLDGKKFDLKKTYKVATHTYSAAICTSPRKDQGRDLNIQTSQMMMNYLERRGTINYAGACRVKPAKP